MIGKVWSVYEMQKGSSSHLGRKYLVGSTAADSIPRTGLRGLGEERVQLAGLVSSYAAGHSPGSRRGGGGGCSQCLQEQEVGEGRLVTALAWVGRRARDSSEPVHPIEEGS